MRQIKVSIIIFFPIIYYTVKCDSPIGHGLELGHHRSSDGHIDILTVVPSPQIFWSKYGKTRTPVLLRGAAKDFPSYSLWTDSYLKKNFGDLEVKLEAKHEKENTPIGERGVGRDTLQNFINNYQTKDSYIVSQLPDPMTEDVNVLACLSCGSLSTHILEANLWLSSGGTCSLLHRDADNAINCLLNGTKDWILINPKYEQNIPIAQGDHGHGGFAVLDVNNVNLLKYHHFQNVSWHYANMTPGDCLFLPYGYWHQVRSYGSKNMAVSVLFSRLKEFNSSGCDQETYLARPLSKANMVWTYPGYGPQTLGNADPFEVRDMLVNMAKETARENQTFVSSVLYHELTKLNILDEEARHQVVQDIYKSLLYFTHGEITEGTISNLTIEQLKTLASYFEEDPANSEEYENAIFLPRQIRATIKKAMNIDDGKLTLQTLARQYMIVGGSERIARDMFIEMDLNNDDVIIDEEMTETIAGVLKHFEKKMKTLDQSYDYYVEELTKDKNMMKNEDDGHKEL